MYDRGVSVARKFLYARSVSSIPDPRSVHVLARSGEETSGQGLPTDRPEARRLTIPIGTALKDQGLGTSLGTWTRQYDPSAPTFGQDRSDWWGMEQGHRPLQHSFSRYEQSSRKLRMQAELYPSIGVK